MLADQDPSHVAEECADKVPVSFLMDKDIYDWLVKFMEEGSNAFLPTVEEVFTIAVRSMMEPDHPLAFDPALFKELIEYTRAPQTQALQVMK